MPTFTEINDATLALWNLLYPHWLSVELFSPSWFAIVIPMILMYVVFFVFIDKSRLRELILYGSLLAVSFGYIDIVGTTMFLWEYKTHFLPFIPSLIPLSYTIHPIVHVFAYQFAASWRSFAITNTLASLFFAFIAQPLYVWLQVFHLQNWNYFYSFVLSWGIAFLARAVVIWLANIEQKHAIQQSRTSLSPELQPAMKLLDQDDKTKE